MFDYSKLKGKIKEVCDTQSAFARKMGYSLVTMSDKLNNKTEWNQSDIENACEILNIPREEITTYFFTEKAQ